MYMSEVDAPNRLSRYDGCGVIERLAISENDRWDLPDDFTFSAETKKTDSRYPWYVGRYGTRCAELDALDPRVLRVRVEEAIKQHIEWDSWNRAHAVEKVELASIQGFVTDWQKLFSGPARKYGGAAVTALEYRANLCTQQEVMS